MDATWVAVAIVGAAVAGHLWADARARPAARAALKALASAGFLAIAALRHVPDPYASLVVAGLALSALGDLCLLGTGQGLFLGGVGAFLLAHLAYASAFAPRSHPSLAVALGLGALAALVVRWLWPHLGALRIPVLVYAAAISLMLLLGLGTPRPLVQAGAALFYASDILVARDRFVAPGLVNRVVGLPLYYGAQVLLAFTVG
jgi:uncharacterized membrane protein YhhN